MQPTIVLLLRVFAAAKICLLTRCLAGMWAQLTEQLLARRYTRTDAQIMGGGFMKKPLRWA
jgi:hypothetical protein